MAAGRRRRYRACALVMAALLVGACVAIACLGASMAESSRPEASPTRGESGEENPIDWDYWKGVNPDIVAWVRVPGTAIDQPVVQARPEDPGWYLAHDVYGEWSAWGSVYVDAGCTAGLASPNVVVYGHNMGFDDTMFHDFANYHDASYAAGHSEIILYTPESVRHLQVAGSATIGGWEELKRTRFSDAADFRIYREECMAACDVRLCEGLPYGQMFTFCTCSYYFNPENERTLVFAF